MNSLNHYAYGSVVEWMYAYMAGIRQAEDSVGFQKGILAPVIDPRVGQVRCEYNSASGLWKSAWEIREGNHIKLSFSVPFGCEAVLYLPKAPKEVFTYTGNPIFACVRDQVCYLEAGEYETAYQLWDPGKAAETE